jgi:hypothetical protein
MLAASSEAGIVLAGDPQQGLIQQPFANAQYTHGSEPVRRHIRHTNST